MEVGDGQRKPSPAKTANIFSKITFWWMKGIIFNKKKNLTANDLYATLPEDSSEILGDILEKEWLKERESAVESKRLPSLRRVLFKLFAPKFGLYITLSAIYYSVFKCMEPFFLSQLLKYYDKEPAITHTEALGYGIGIIFTLIASSFLYHNFKFGSTCIGMRIRVACCSLLYRKVMHLKHSTTRDTAASLILNLMSNDVNRFDFFPYVLVAGIQFPIQAAVVLYLMWYYVSSIAFIGFIIMAVISFPLNKYNATLSAKFRTTVAQKTDRRIQLMTEILSGIKVIKMYAWEKPFEKLISLARRKELKAVKPALYLRSVILAVAVILEKLVLYVMLICYVLFGNEISSDKVFALCQILNSLQLCMVIYLSLAVYSVSEADITIKRIQEFLLLEIPDASFSIDGAEEMVPLKITRNSNGNYNELKHSMVHSNEISSAAITFHNVYARWETNSNKYNLSNINLTIGTGTLCAVVGPIGAGKSTMLQTVLQELTVSSGELKVFGKLSYASQEPWIFSASVRKNILFGKPFDENRYKQVVNVCALEKDFDLFPNGDETIIGERGASLSGGQCARINLARCIYHEADIYLLDDPLSAVDAQVGKHIFYECIKQFLNGKTCLLVTHQLKYTEEADNIVILNDGKIEKYGSFQSLQEETVFKILGSQNKGDCDLQDNDFHSSQNILVAEGDKDDKLNDTDETELEEKMPLLEQSTSRNNVWLKFILDGNNICFVMLVVVLFFLGQVANSGIDYWISYWILQEQIEPGIYPCNYSFTSREIIHNINNITDENTENKNLTLNFQPIDTLMSNASNSLTTQQPCDLLGMEEENVHIPGRMISTEVCIYIYTICIVCCAILITLRAFGAFIMLLKSSTYLHSNTLNKILNAPLSFFNSNQSGRILNRFFKDMGVVDESMPRNLIEALQIVFIIVGFIILMLLVNIYLIVSLVLLGSLYVIIQVHYIHIAKKIQHLEGSSKSPMLTHTSSTLNGLSTVRTFGAQKVLCNQFDELQDGHTSAFYLSISVVAAFGLFLDLIGCIFASTSIIYFLFLDNDEFGGWVGLNITYAIRLPLLLPYSIKVLSDAITQLVSLERLMEYSNIKTEPLVERSTNKSLPKSWPVMGGIRFENVSFQYTDDGPKILKNLSFTIGAGEKIGIIGRTGAGKSSLIATLLRLAKMQGTVFIDDVDILTVDIKHLRSSISVLPQQPVLFSGSLRFNLDPYGYYSDSTLWEALEEVEVKESIKSLDAAMNTGGSNFSVGQRQLICLARAILRKNKIIILDEATANVDQHTDNLIQETIQKKFKEYTVLTIAHRINTVMACDRILVLEDGQIVEFDSPEQLSQEKTSYFYKILQQMKTENQESQNKR